MSAIAPQLADLARTVLGTELPVRLRAWDGSEAGPADGPVGIVRSRRALRTLLWAPGELGLARAYVTGDLDVEGDLYELLARCWELARAGTLGAPKLSVADKVALAAKAARLGALGPRPKPPVHEARLSGRLHTRGRDRDAIAHHYDLSNEFYQRLLESNLAYSCGYWTSTEPGYTHDDAQRDKLDLVCRKLGLRPGMRMLDVGCGWGSLVVHAAKHYDVRVTGVTISRQQHDFVTKRIADDGLQDRASVLLRDYREIAAEPFDAIGTLEMGEHVGKENYRTYTETLFRLLKPEGRLLLQQMSRGAVAPGGGAFIESYIAPDMNMEPVGDTVNEIERAGFEVRDVHAMREHYVWTVRAWARTLEDGWDSFVALVGVEQARIWRLYLVGGALAFAENRMGVNQILAVKPTANGGSGMPRTRAEQVL